MTEIIRTPTLAKGGITPEEFAKLQAHTDMWIKRVMRTDPIEPEKIVPAIERLYAAAGLKKPRVVIAPSPFVANVAAGLAASIWYLRKNGKPADAATRAATYDATDAATYDATRAATYDATDAATYAATDAATYAATYDATDAATYAATDAATYAATRAATDAATYDATDAATKKHRLFDLVRSLTPNAIEFSLGVIKVSWRIRQGGNHWGAWDSYLTALRDVIGLTGLDCWEKYSAWEDAAIHGSWRMMHDEFCIVSDFPETLLKDEQNRPHCEFGPSHRWRDGFEIYHLDGLQLEKEMHRQIMSQKMTFGDLMAIQNADIRAVALKYNPQAIISNGAELLDRSERGNELYLIKDTDLNEFLEEPEVYFLKMECPTGRTFVEGVDPEFGRKNPKADVCQAYALGITPTQYRNLAVEG